MSIYISTYLFYITLTHLEQLRSYKLTYASRCTGNKNNPIIRRIEGRCQCR